MVKTFHWIDLVTIQSPDETLKKVIRNVKKKPNRKCNNGNKENNSKE